MAESQSDAGRATIDDVAQRAGVSVATVSRALRGRPNVAPATRRKVEMAALELAYRPDPHASRLAAGRTLTVGIAVPLIGSWYFSQVIAGAEDVLRGDGYDLHLLSVGSGVQRSEMVAAWGELSRRVDALVLVDIPLPAGEAARLVEGGRVIVTVGEQHPGHSSVRIDNHQGARLATQHLLNAGHHSIGVVGVDPPGTLGFVVPTARLAGYRAALTAAGLPLRPELEAPAPYTIEGGYEAAVQLLAAPDPPTAVFAFSDELAFGVLRAAEQLGLRVPEDLSVVGFDDHSLSGYVGLTTIAQPVAEIGAAAARRVLAVLHGDDRAPADQVLPVRLVVRRTTARRPS